MRKPGFYKAKYRGFPAVGYCRIEFDGAQEYEWWTVLFETEIIPNHAPSVASSSFGVRNSNYADFEVLEPIG